MLYFNIFLMISLVLMGMSMVGCRTMPVGSPKDTITSIIPVVQDIKSTLTDLLNNPDFIKGNCQSGCTALIEAIKSKIGQYPQDQQTAILNILNDPQTSKLACDVGCEALRQYLLSRIGGM